MCIRLDPWLDAVPANVLGRLKAAREVLILSHENPAVFVDMGNSHFEILTKYDLMSTVASLMEQKR